MPKGVSLFSQYNVPVPPIQPGSPIDQYFEFFLLENPEPGFVVLKFQLICFHNTSERGEVVEIQVNAEPEDANLSSERFIHYDENIASAKVVPPYGFGRAGDPDPIHKYGFPCQQMANPTIVLYGVGLSGNSVAHKYGYPACCVRTLQADLS